MKKLFVAKAILTIFLMVLMVAPMVMADQLRLYQQSNYSSRMAVSSLQT